MSDKEVLAKEFVRWNKLASVGDRTVYICVRADGHSYSCTVVDGYILTRSLLATNVEV